MGLNHSLITAAALVVFMAGPSSADTPPPVAEPPSTWECMQTDGSLIYTNKEKAGCRAMTLKPLSVVPSLDNMPLIPQPVAVPHYQGSGYTDRPASERLSAPEWARDWRASIAPGGSVHEETCSLFSEWLHLVQKTRGGIFYGSDPSYGGDVSSRNQRGPSYSYYDNARYVTLSRIFGAGFVPVGCP